jgi:hypothetical protein
VIEQARRRRRARRTRLVLSCALLGGALIWLIIAAASGGTRAPRQLRLPTEAPHPVRLRGGALLVRLTPNLEGSMAGWCVDVETRGGSRGTCDPLPTRAHPFMEGGTGWSLGERAATTVVVTAPAVAQVRFEGGLRAPTVPMASLPYGMRVAILHTPHSPRPRAIRVLATLGASGQTLSRSPDYGDGIPFHDWGGRQGSPRGSCELRLSAGSHATPEWGQVGLAIHPYPGAIVGGGFLSCADTEYYVPGRGMRAAVLLDAQHPNASVPAPIPGLVAVPQVPGYFNANPDEGLQEPLTARREGDAWVVVAGGGRDAEAARIGLLEHLAATIRG